MADIVIEPGASTYAATNSPKVGPVWTNSTTAYVFYPIGAGADVHSSLYYRKTIDGGATWAAPVLVKAPADYGIRRWSIWYDRWTPGDAGTKIHIAYIDFNTADVFYRSLDTATDTLSGEVLIFSDFMYTDHVVDITKARGGTLYCGYWVSAAGNGFKKSIDGGATWSVCTTMADGAAADIILLLPGNEADPNDIWCIYWDVSANEVMLKVYDNSGNSWSETLISAGIVDNIAALYYNIDCISASQRHSDNHVILAVWSEYNQPTADLKVWDIGGAGSIVAKTDVLTNSNNSSSCAVFIDQLSDYIYVAYLTGSAWGATVNPFYKRSIDGGTTWGAQMPLSDGPEDHIIHVWAGHSVDFDFGIGCGYFMPVWVNEDLTELDTNIVNAVYICAPPPPPPPPPSPPAPTPEEATAEAAAPPFEILLYDRGMNLKAALFPLETGDCGNIQPISINWTRCWQQAGTFELVIPAQTPYLNDLMSLGSYIMFRRADTGAFEALYIIEHAELQIGIINYILDSSENVNAIYAAGQGTGTLRDIAYAENAASILSMGRLEYFLDARDSEKDNLALLIQQAEAEITKTKPYGSIVAKAGEPAEDELVTVSGRSLLSWCANRIVLPPPGTQAAGVVDITTAEYDQNPLTGTAAADVVMRDYVDTHLINPLDGTRKVWNFINGAAIAPLGVISYQSRLETVLDALQKIAALSNCGMEVVLNALNQFEFRILPQVDRTWSSGLPVVFRSKEVLLSIPGRVYRDDWDIGYLISLEVEELGLVGAAALDMTILAVTHTLEAGVAPVIGISFDTSTASDVERFRGAITDGDNRDIKAARA